jgi:hypothetical protein
VVAALLVGPAANADDAADLEVGDDGAHCAMGVDPLPRGVVVADADLPEPVVDCFPTFAEAIEFVTEGELTASSPEELEATLAEPMTAAVAPTSSRLLGIEYRGVQYTNSSLALYGSGSSGCTTGSSYGFPSMPSGWNNVISSARAYAGCRSTHYAGTSYSGSTITCSSSCPSMAQMNNRTSSIRFRP